MGRTKKTNKNATPKKRGRPKGSLSPYIYTDEHLDSLAESLYEWVNDNIESNDQQFLLRDWCFAVGFHYANFSRYIAKNAKFKEAYNWAKAWQEHQVSKGALMNTLNPRFATFFLGCNHNWRMKEKEADKEHKALTSLEELNRKLNSIQDKIDAEQL